jgi:antitoxin component YwqK of YwqJK toxin-antitoxin module
MKIKIIGILIFFCSIFTISSQEEINRVNEKGDREGTWKKFYNNGRIRYQGQFEAGKEVGVFNYYSMVSSEHAIIIKTFSKENNIATVEFYSESGVIESKGKMNGKNRVGKWVYYHTNGKIVISEENYQNGLLNGESKTYYKSGKTTEILQYKDGKLHGNINRFANNGILIDDLNYTNGKLNGLAKYYNLEGDLIYTGQYENDEKIGKWEYFENGKPVDPIKFKQ